MNSYTLGLDLGSASIGWAIVEPTRKVIDCGVRIFDPGVNLDDFTKGRDGSSNNVVRRMARLHRRQLRRRAARQRDLFRLLQRNKLLPGEDVQRDSGARHRLLESLDGILRQRWQEEIRRENLPEQALIYLLRKHALDKRLNPDELGRVLYQLGQRRGFKSNRKDVDKATKGSADHKKTDDELGKVKAGIAELSIQIGASGARTLGEYFVGAAKAGQPIRRQWTARQMFISEFEAVWESQRRFHPLLTPELKQEVYALLFYQRPIARNEHLVGKCELEPGERRAPMCSLTAQKFRIIQKVNDLEYGGLVHTQPLSAEERGKLIEKLTSVGDLTFDSIRELLNLDKSVRFNLACGGEKKLPGNRTNAAMLRAIPRTWPQLSPSKKDGIVEAWNKAENDEDLVATLTSEYELSIDEATAIAAVHPEDGYARLSLIAMNRLLPLMEGGMRFKTAEERVYGSSFSGGKPLDLLPPVVGVLPQVPNPAVMRALTELRKVVNAIVRKHGKPAEIRIELARELKRNADQRERDWKNMRSREAQRKAALKRILEEAHRPQPSGRDIERVLLFEECGGICPYCGEQINFQRLFDGDVDVDHILPRSKFPDNSFANKVIAHRSCNHRKLGRTPSEAFGAEDTVWEQILARVAKWRNTEKLQRFRIADGKEFETDGEDTFAARRLNDTRYVSKLAARYVACLYGGRDARQLDGSNRRVVFASSGMLTALLRREWKLESILEEAAPATTSRKMGKQRTDHRHHSVDAIVIALSSNAMVGRVSAAAAAAGYGGARTSSSSIASPWANFVDSIRPHIEKIIVSHRPSHKLNGPLHDETNYSAPRETTVYVKGRKKAASKTVVHVRKPVHLLKAKQVEDIVDPAVRCAVKEKLAQVGETAKLENNLPMLKTRGGKQVPIRRVRVRVPTAVSRIGGGNRERFVASGGNHHVAIFETRNKKGEPQWESAGVVSRLDAIRRKGSTAIIEKQLRNEETAQFLFALMSGDVVEMLDERNGGRNYYVVRTVSDSELTFVRHSDARKLADMERGSVTGADVVRARGEGKFDKLRQWNCRKVFVDVLGKVHG